ncbi:hypothetical protein HMPREF0724_14670 [Prescottella equi ATCC 33707]|uniref:Uncharacterized protein n=1 Tax=Prescottella equi ATCC 33707 TaxID=525370 RepID=E9T7B4_RHOHA|nr:hypothetical protein HMPREF0724_14670 [Prescottella equi ATCC 33707]
MRYGSCGHGGTCRESADPGSLGRPANWSSGSIGIDDNRTCTRARNRHDGAASAASPGRARVFRSQPKL